MRRKPATTSGRVLSSRKRTGARNGPKNGRQSTVKSKRPASRKLTAEDKALRKAHQRFFAEAETAGFTWLD